MKIRQIVTDAAQGQRLEETVSEMTVYDPGCMNRINFYPDVRYQTVTGFGGAFTEAAGWAYAQLDANGQKALTDAYFGADGIGYSLGRVAINSCDFALGNYAYVTDENDAALAGFDLSRDRQYVLPLIHAAQAVSRRPLRFLASPWSPPAFMKTNGEMNHGGKLKPEYARRWAEYMARFVREYQNEGVPIGYLTVQNEPEATQTWDSCRYTAEEEAAFVRDHLGPVLREQGLAGRVKLLVWDHNKEELYNRARTILSDEQAAAFVDGIAFHWYTGDHFDAIRMVAERWQDKELLFTEGCVEYSRFADTGEIAKAEMYAHDMLGDLVHGAGGFIDWNLLLDDRGGPNHVGNFCAAPIMLDGHGGLEQRLSYYYIGQFSKFIQPGAVRVATTRAGDTAEVLGCVNPDGSRVLVMLNKTDRGTEYALLDDQSRHAKNGWLAPHSITTLVWSEK